MSNIVGLLTRGIYEICWANCVDLSSRDSRIGCYRTAGDIRQVWIDRDRRKEKVAVFLMDENTRGFGVLDHQTIPFDGDVEVKDEICAAQPQDGEDRCDELNRRIHANGDDVIRLDGRCESGCEGLGDACT